MSHGSAHTSGQLQGKNPIDLTSGEWAKVALSGEGIYKPMINSNKEFESFGMAGPRLVLRENGEGDITGDGFNMETIIFETIDRNNSFFEQRTGRNFVEISPSEFGNSRNEVVNGMMNYPKSIRGDRVIDYQMVASGAMNPWVRNVNKIVSKLETTKVTNSEQLDKRVREIFNDKPLLKVAVAKYWNERVKNGNITRYKADKWKKKYL